MKHLITLIQECMWVLRIKLAMLLLGRKMSPLMSDAEVSEYATQRLVDEAFIAYAAQHGRADAPTHVALDRATLQGLLRLSADLVLTVTNVSSLYRERGRQ